MTTIVNTIRWADNTAQLKANLLSGIDTLDVMKTSVDRLVSRMGGTGLFEAANRTAAAILELGGVTKLTSAEQQRSLAIIDKAIEKYTVMGRTAPSALTEIADALRPHPTLIGSITDKLGALGSSWVARVAEGILLRDAIHAIIGKVKDLATFLPELALKGAGVADVEENFKHLTAQAVLLGDVLLGKLREGTHNTVDDFQLMKLVNQDLAAGLKLTDDQFGVLAKGAFALAQATGVDVKSALDTMNDAMLTGRVRSLALLTGKIDASAAEDLFAKSLKNSSANLTEAGKLEANRAAILDAVSAATKRLGEQTDGLDERVQQVQVAWANFTDDLGKTIATSATLETAIDGVQKILIDAFGGSQRTLIAAITRAIDDATIQLVGLGTTGVQVGGFLAKEFIALQKIFGDVMQVVDGLRLTFMYANREAARVRSWTDATGKAREDMLAIDEAIGGLLISMKKRGDALQEADRQQAGVDATTAKYVGTMEALREKVEKARAATSEFVGPLREQAGAHDKTGEAAGRHGDALFKTSKAEDKFAESVKNATTYQALFGELVTTIDGRVAEGTRFYLARGAAVEDLARMYGLTTAQVKALAEQMKFEASVSELSAKAFGVQGAMLTPLVARYGAFHEVLTGVDDETGLLTSSLIDSGTATFNFANQEAFAAKQTEGLRKQLKDLRAPVQSLGETLLGTLKQVPQMLANAFTGGGGLLGAVKGIGTMVGAGIGESIGKDVKALGQFGGPIGAAVGSLAGPLIQMFAGLFDHVLAHLARDAMEKFGTKFSAATTEAIKKSMKGGLTEIAAELTNLSSIIADSGGLSDKNLGTMTARLRDVFSMIQTGQLSVSQGTTILNDNWQAFVTAATDGDGRISDSLKEIIRLNEVMGTQSKEIASFLRQQGSNAVSGFAAVVEGSIGAVEGYEALTKAVEDAEAAQRAAIEAGIKGAALDKLNDQVAAAIAARDAMAANVKGTVSGYDDIKRAVDKAKAAVLDADKEITKTIGGTAAVARGSEDAIEKLTQTLIVDRGAIDDASAAYDKLAKSGKATGAQLEAALAKVALAQLKLKTDTEALLKLQGSAGTPGTTTTGIDEEAAKAAAGSLEQALKAQREAAEEAKQGLSDLGIQAVASFTAAVASGTSEADALKAIHPALQTLQRAYDDLGLSVDDVALAAIMMRDKITTAAPQLMAAIGGLNQEMIALDNMGLMNVETFGAMQRTGVAMYQRLKEKVLELGGTDKDALGQMQLFLHQAMLEAKNLGVPLDENTQKLIDQSKEAGVWQAAITPQDKLLSGMQTLVDKVSDLVNALMGIPPKVDTTVTTHFVTDGSPPDLSTRSAGDYAARGGLVTASGIVQHLGRGGTVASMMPSGTDTVPAMLTPGEIVLNQGQQRNVAEGLVAGARGGSVIDYSEFRELKEQQAAARASLERIERYFSMDFRRDNARAIREAFQDGRRRG